MTSQGSPQTTSWSKRAASAVSAHFSKRVSVAKERNARSPKSDVNMFWPLVGVGLVTGMSLLTIGLDGKCKLDPNEACKVIVPVTTIAWSWQSLLGATFTLLAAVYGAWFVLRQIRQVDHQERDRKDRRRRSQRATMPLVMSETCEFAEQSMERLTKALPIAQRYGRITADRLMLRAPKLSPAVVKEITAMIEAADGSEGDAYIELLGELQVHLARWRSFEADLKARRNPRIPRDIEVEIVDAGEIYARASNLLAVSRPVQRREETAMSRRGALLLLGLHDDLYAAAVTYAENMDARAPLNLPDRGAP